jgi:biotin carboxyl carrier protein
MKRTLTIGEETHELEIHRHSGRVFMVWDGEEHPLDICKVEPTSYSIIMDGHSVGVNIDRRKNSDPDLHVFRASVYDGAYDFSLQDPHKILLAAAMARQPQTGGGLVKALMPGKLLKLFVQEGEVVEEGQPLLLLEAMKMQNEYTSPVSAKVSKIHVSEGVNLEINTPMISLVPLEAPAKN